MMNEIQINKLRMYQSVRFLLDDSANVWNSIPIMGKLKSGFDKFLDTIIDDEQVQQKAKVHVGKSLLQVKKVTAEKGDILNDAIEAFAKANNLLALEMKAAKTYDDLFSLGVDDFIAAIKEIIEMLEEHIAVLGEYGVNAAQIADLKHDLDTFLMINDREMLYASDRQATVADLQDAFDGIDTLLTTKLDKVITLFKHSDPAFYHKYKDSRVIMRA